MGYMLGYGTCWTCGNPFAFNPERVPSVRDENGVRQPVCRTCMERANRIRAERGLPPHAIPGDAYEPAECE